MVWVDQIAELCKPWNHLFSHSKLVSGSVTGAHIVALLFAGGLAIAADRSTLRAYPRDRVTRVFQAREVQAVHAPVLIGLGVLLASGILLALSDVETFFPSPVFWIKLTLVASLLVNGGILTATERSLNTSIASAPESAPAEDRLWSRMRVLAWTSVTLWTATAVTGIVLSNVS